MGGVEMEEEITLEDLKELIEKRITWVGKTLKSGKSRSIPVNFDGLLGAVLSGAIPNMSRLKNVKTLDKASTPEEAAEVILQYLMSRDSISSSHFPTLLQRKEAPNYQFQDYTLSSYEDAKKRVIYWLLTFYYLELIKEKQHVIVAIRSDNPEVEKILQEYLVVGSEFEFKLKAGRIETTYLDKSISYYFPPYPSAAYFTLLLLFSAILTQLRFQYTSEESITNAQFESMILSKHGGNKWSVIYHPVGSLSRLYNMFFKELKVPKQRFIVFLESLMPPSLQNRNIMDSYYSLLSDLAFSILVEGYLNVNKLSKVIGEKISLELRAKRENRTHKLGKIYYADYIQTKFFGGGNMGEDFEKLRKQMKAIALKIGELAKKGDTQKSLLKRIIMDVKSEEIPVYFVETLVSYLPRLEREGIRITLPDELVSLPIKEFLILKNEFVVTLWNSYAGNKQS
ncbi:hypothetical protein [Thermococcus sp.]